jgi:hypothetical protein
VPLSSRRSAVPISAKLSLRFAEQWHLQMRGGGSMSVKYSIRVEKDGANVTARYDLRIPVDTTELLASFELNVEGKNLIDTFMPQKAFTGTKFYILTNPSADTAVTFAITTSETWTADGTDKLRGQKRYDDVSFSN